MRKTNGQGGITLIALVVTIVVLLILAGITIMYVFGSDGIFATANDAKVESVLGTIRDYVSNAQGQALIESYKPEADLSTFETVRAKEIFSENFPDSASVTTTSLTYDLDTHKYGATATGTYNGVSFTVTFTDGVPEVTGEAAPTEDEGT